ncbi:hypothetical protein PVAP13_9NG671714 [Panicum virgatum]|uniref:Uncharacterized protein n=1 Tax=Panicum virgatum TaxID=38727 RepID=A0A8T0N0Y4_PANVG|nr:hypothetical protein PVAP13_9NG671714 [Panicum virgatum]
MHGGRRAAGVAEVVGNKDVAALLDPAHAVCTTQPSRPSSISRQQPSERSLPHRLILLCSIGGSSRVPGRRGGQEPPAPDTEKQGSLTNRRGPSPFLTAPRRAPPPSPPHRNAPRGK